VISAPREDTFNVVPDRGSCASWNPDHPRLSQLDDGPVGNGTRFEWDLRGFGKVTQELREFDHNRQVRIVPHMKQIESRSSLSPQQTRRADTDRSRTGDEAKGAFVLFAPMMGMMGRKNLRDTADALQARLEV
jgi:hypothetical protein